MNKQLNNIKMNAAVLEGYGNANVISYNKVDKPTPKENEVLIEIVAASATTADKMMISGKPYFARLFTGLTKPKHKIPGTGFAGRIVEMGSKVTQFNIGDEVFGETTLGFSTNAEYLAIPEDGTLLKKPENIAFSEAATLCDGTLTSMNFLTQVSQVHPQDKILINGASGSLGTAAIQLAKYYGAEVTAVCSGKNAALVKSLGADHVIDYTQNDFTKTAEKFQIIFDTIGKSSYFKCKNILSPTGQYISPVLNSPIIWAMFTTSLFRKKKAKFAATGLKKGEELRIMLQDVLKIISEGKLKTIIDRQFPLEKVSKAHQYIATGRKRGNIVIIINS